MTSIDNFFQYFSIKFVENNDIILDDILIENINFPINNIQYSTTLSINEFEKNRIPHRADVVLDKINNVYPYTNIFLDKTYKKVQLSFISDEFMYYFKNRQFNNINNKTHLFKDDYENQYSLSDLIKTYEFGGKPKGASLLKETQALNQSITILRKILEENKLSSINIKLGDIIYDDCIDIINQTGLSKSDFNIINKDKQSVIFISHKDGNQSRDFMRWGGFIKYDNHPEIVDFKKSLNKELLPGQSYYKKITDDNLKYKLLFGKDYSNNFGPNNVNCIIQGNIYFNKINNNTYELTGDKIWLNGILPQSSYEPILVAMYRDGRKDLKIKNCNVLCSPISLMLPNITKMK